MGKGRRAEWQIKNINDVKKEIKQLLDAAMAEGGVRKRFEKIMRGIRESESSIEPRDLLFLYIYIVSALIHHKNWGGLNNQQIKKLVSLGYSILQMQNIQPETSILGFLYGELHMALSQIYRTNGDHFAATWEQQVSHQVSKKRPPGGESYQSLAKAIRAFRLGHIQRALEEYMTIVDGSLTRTQREMARIGRVRCWRLLKKYDECLHHVDLWSREDASGRFVNELHWERLCVTASSDQDLAPMMEAVQRKGSHYQAVYILESYFWAMSWPQRKWISRLAKVSTVARNKKLQAKDSGFFLKAALCLEECSDSNIPLVVRIKALGNILKESNQFLAIDREMLFFVASSRWLAKSHSPTLAATVLGEYEGASFKISRGQSNDSLNVAADLFSRSWYSR